MLRGGARGLRGEGVDNIRAFRSLTENPIIGLSKRYHKNQVFITSDFAAARSLAEAGASIIAVDCTDRDAPFREPWPVLVRRIRGQLALPVLADIATVAEARQAIAAGVDAVATTLAGYTPASAGLVGAAWDLLTNLVRESPVPVILEGRVETPADFRRGLELGAYAVVVGTAITRPENITARFAAVSPRL